MEFIPKAIADYAELYSESESSLLKELNRYTWAHMMYPRMLSGHMQGRILSLFSQLVRPKNILEIGTYTGYSALCLAEGLAEDGKLYTIDANPEYQEVAKMFFARSDYHSQIICIEGLAKDLIPDMKENWDLVFIDADKINYLNYYNLIKHQVRKGGLIIIDNVLWSGKVIQENELLKDAETQAIHQLNQYVSQDNLVKSLLLPVRDGMMILRKL